MSDDLDEDTSRFIQAFRKIRRGSAVRKIEALTAIGDIALEEMETLFILSSLGQPCRMGELAALAESNPANTARTIKSLAARQLVNRSRSNADGRGALVELTASGRVTAEQMRSHRSRLLNAVLRALPGGNSKRIVKALEDLSIALEKAVAEL